MKKHRILVSYATGNSFGSHETEDYLDLSWDNLDVAKENLQAIKEHYKMYNEIEGPSWNASKRSREDALDQYKNNWWFPENDNSFHTHNLMKLKTDSGKTMQQWNFWCGYFETLHEAEIVSEDNDMKFKL